MGLGIAENQQELTPLQRQVLVKEKIRQKEEEQAAMEDAKNGKSSNKSSKKPNARSSKVQAIKDSQEEEEAFVNKKVVDKE